MGQAADQPKPVVADPKDFPNGSGDVWKSSLGALVQFQNVKVTSTDKFQDFGVSADGTNSAIIASNFLRIADKNFMAPMMGTDLVSVTGIVLPDFKGEVWARTAQDVVPKM